MTPAAAEGSVRVVVAGIGNEYRRDDGVGAAVAARVVEKDDTVCDVGPVVDPIDLLGKWDGAEVAVVIDAVRSGQPAGTVRVTEVRPGAASGGGREAKRRNFASSHSIDIPEVLRLASTVGRAPRRVVVVGVAGADFGRGIGLTAAVEAAVNGAAEAVLGIAREARSCA